FRERVALVQKPSDRSSQETALNLLVLCSLANQWPPISAGSPSSRSSPKSAASLPPPPSPRRSDRACRAPTIAPPQLFVSAASSVASLVTHRGRGIARPEQSGACRR